MWQRDGLWGGPVCPSDPESNAWPCYNSLVRATLDKLTTREEMKIKLLFVKTNSPATGEQPIPGTNYAMMSAPASSMVVLVEPCSGFLSSVWQCRNGLQSDIIPLFLHPVTHQSSYFYKTYRAWAKVHKRKSFLCLWWPSCNPCCEQYLIIKNKNC